MEEVVINGVLNQGSNSVPDPENSKPRLETTNKIIFNIFRILGCFPIKWASKLKMYRIQPKTFIIYYILWFLWPLIGLAIALCDRFTFNSDETTDQVDDVIETSLFILGFTVIPAISTYSINLISRHLPEVLEDIASLGEINPGFQTPLNIHILSRNQNDLKEKKDFTKSASYQDHDKILSRLPAVMLGMSVLVSISLGVFGILDVVEWSTISKEWPFLVMQFFYLIQPAITTWFCVFFVEWLRMVYEAMRVELDFFFHNALKSFETSSKTTESKTTDATVIGSFNEEKIKITGDYVDKLQEIFLGLIEGFVKFITSVNFLVCLVCSVFCTLQLLQDFHLIMYMIPLAIAIGHMDLICYKSNQLMDEHDRILLVLKNLERLERRNPNLLPYNELHILRENLLESPPQVVVFGGYGVGNGLLIAIHGFILSYAMLANDILDIQDGSSKGNSTSGA